MSFRCLASSQQARTMPIPSAGCLFRLPTIDRNYPAATAVKSGTAFAHRRPPPSRLVHAGHTRQNRIPSTEELRALTNAICRVTLPAFPSWHVPWPRYQLATSKGSLHRGAWLPTPAVAISTTWNYTHSMQRLSADQQHALPPGLLLAALHATASLM